tara:strand:+ start:703 stop:864 length:162 start_codon:yes stop_codon:yes gene_type:complete
MFLGTYKLNLTPDNFAVMTSGTEALNACFHCFFDDDDEVIMFEPYFPCNGHTF